MKIGAIVQARMGSTRLPGKVLKKIKGRTVLEHVINRLRLSNMLDEIIVATTINDADNQIYELCKKNNFKVFRGSENDVLKRYYDAAIENNIDVVVRITSDCPLIDPKIVDQIISMHLDNQFGITTNAGIDDVQRTFPRGLDVEVFDIHHLKNALMKANKEYQREHVTPFIYETNAGNIGYFKSLSDYSNHRWTLDTQEDFDFIKVIYDHLYSPNQHFFMDDILDLLKSKPEYLKINCDVNQKDIK